MSKQSPGQIHLRAVAYSRECAAALADQRESCRSLEIQLKIANRLLNESLCTALVTSGDLDKIWESEKND